MATSPVDPARPKMKGFYDKASLRPPGSFEVAFPDAAEKMRKVIMQLKEGKIDPISFPQAQTRLENPTPETAGRSLQSIQWRICEPLGERGTRGTRALLRGPLGFRPRPFERRFPPQLGPLLGAVLSQISPGLFLDLGVWPCALRESRLLLVWPRLFSNWSLRSAQHLAPPRLLGACHRPASLRWPAASPCLTAWWNAAGLAGSPGGTQQAWLLSLGRPGSASEECIRPSNASSRGASGWAPPATSRAVTLPFSLQSRPASLPAASRRSLGVSAAEDATPQFATSRWTAQLPKEEITYSWRFAGGGLRTQDLTYFREMPRAQGYLARIRPVQPTHRGTFSCVITHDQRALARLYFFLNVTGPPPRGETKLQASFREVLRWAPREAEVIESWRPSLGELLARPEALTPSNQCLLAAIAALASAGVTLLACYCMDNRLSGAKVGAVIRE
ncbi:sperm acrosome membrane-associated protein 6 isoform X3 [Pteropus alecto]|uniref:sperm acrosome membrane-associated protein 6 isoform X3 n=1 Tax=Pteropus alecto TaxID=9402 RepID=UPI000D539114|nr:sperm acrosome membrane-associated protein 6 isoform X3 [Pteropus alecto]